MWYEASVSITRRTSINVLAVQRGNGHVSNSLASFELEYKMHPCYVFQKKKKKDKERERGGERDEGFRNIADRGLPDTLASIVWTNFLSLPD